MISKEDPFEVIGKIPKDKSYQWVALTVLGGDALSATDLKRFEDGGWKSVPAKRHPKMLHKGKKIIVHGQLLVERDRALTDAALKKGYEVAKAQFDAHNPQNRETKTRAGFPYIPEVAAYIDNNRNAAFSAAEIGEFRDGLKTRRDYSYVEVTIGVVIDNHEFETATEVLHLSPEEYIKRRVYMDTDALLQIDSSTTPGKIPLFRRAEVHIRPMPLENVK